MAKITIPTAAIVDFTKYPKLGVAVEEHINAVNEKELTPKYDSVAQFLIDLLEKEVKKGK